jgi:hypothetical protein
MMNITHTFYDTSAVSASQFNQNFGDFTNAFSDGSTTLVMAELFSTGNAIATDMTAGQALVVPALTSPQINVGGSDNTTAPLAINGDLQVVGPISNDVGWVDLGLSNVTGFASYTTSYCKYKRIGKYIALGVNLVGQTDGNGLKITLPYPPDVGTDTQLGKHICDTQIYTSADGTNYSGPGRVAGVSATTAKLFVYPQWGTSWPGATTDRTCKGFILYPYKLST